MQKLLADSTLGVCPFTKGKYTMKKRIQQRMATHNHPLLFGFALAFYNAFDNNNMLQLCKTIIWFLQNCIWYDITTQETKALFYEIFNFIYVDPALIEALLGKPIEVLYEDMSVPF